MKTLLAYAPRLFALTISLSVAGCGLKKAKDDAELTVARHFEAVASHSRAEVLAGYDQQFFTAVPREEWAKRLSIAETKLGQYQSFTVTSWNVNSKMGMDAGTYVTLTCNVIYSKSTATEAMVLFRTSDDEPFKIVKHGINSDAFLSE